MGNRPLVKFIRHYIRDSSGVVSISSLVRISMKSFPAFKLLFARKYSCLHNNHIITIFFYSLRHLVHKAPTKSLQRSLSCAIFDPSLQARPSLPFSSASTDLLHVNRGLPRLRLSSGVQYRASLVMSFWGFLKMWPIQLHLLLASSTMMSSWLYFTNYHSKIKFISSRRRVISSISVTMVKTGNTKRDLCLLSCTL